MASGFLRGILASKEEKRAQRQSDQLARMRDIEARKSAFNLVRDQEAYGALKDQYGAAAGDPGSLATLQGVEQSKQMFPLEQRAAELQLDTQQLENLRGATGVALRGLKQATANGMSATDYMRSLPDKYKQVAGLDDNTIQQYGQMFDQNPDTIDALLSSVTKPKTQGSLPKPQKGQIRDPETGKMRDVFWNMTPEGPAVVDGIVPQAESGYFAPKIEDGIAYIRGKDGTVRPVDFSQTSNRAAMSQKYSETYGGETAKLDASAGEGNSDRQAALANVVRAGGTVVRDASTALDIMQQDRSFRGTGPAAATSRLAQAKIPGTNEYEVEQLLNSMKANIGIDSLLNIKREGAGLGQVPQSQLETLQSLLGNMNVGRDPRLLTRDVREVVDLYNDVVADADMELQQLETAPRRPRGNPARRQSIYQDAPIEDTSFGDSSDLSDSELDAKYGIGGN